MRIYRLGAIAAIGLLAACGGGDDAEPAASNTDGTVEPADEPAAEPADEPADANDANDADDANDANDADDADNADSGNSAMSLDDIPQECRDIMAELLREIEPVVQDVDWENATMSDLIDLGDSIDAPVSELDVQMDQAGCNDLDFNGDDEAGFDLALELARQEAPGVVGWLQFLRDASEGFDVAADGTADEPADVPEDCDEALDAVRALMDEADTMMDLPVDQLLAASTTIQNITTVCTIDEMSGLFEDPDFTAWTEG